MDIPKKVNEIIQLKDNLIGRHKYNQLKMNQLEGLILTDIEKKQIELYEEKGISKPLTDEKAKLVEEYYKRVSEPKPKNEYEFNAKELLDLFLTQYSEYIKKNSNNELIVNNESRSNILPLVYYFTKDDRFFKCENIVQSFNYDGSIKTSEPSFDKGLLIVGGYGNGKTSIMNVFHRLFSRFDNLKFRSHNANDIVEMYELCDNADSKYSFWHRLNKDIIYFDDIKTERIASNYGKLNLFKDIIEKREIRNLKTFITCNYRESKHGDINDAILEFGELYGSRVFDRVFKMFNIIEFKGKSFRK